MWWAQFDALEMGTGWDITDIKKPQILIEDAWGDSHPGSKHLNTLTEQAKYGVLERGGFPAMYHTTDICDGCAQGNRGMHIVLASREAIADMVEMHASAVSWDGMILCSSCDKSIPGHLKAAARMDIPTILFRAEAMTKYQCGPCGCIYDPAAGDPDRGIRPGTAFADLPDDWTCPICGVPKDQFHRL